MIAAEFDGVQQAAGQKTGQGLLNSRDPMNSQTAI